MDYILANIATIVIVLIALTGVVLLVIFKVREHRSGVCTGNCMSCRKNCNKRDRS